MSFGQAWNEIESWVMIVPTGRARWATSTLGPWATGGATASACGAELPVSTLRAARPVPIAMISAPISSNSFFLSMALQAPLE